MSETLARPRSWSSDSVRAVLRRPGLWLEAARALLSMMSGGTPVESYVSWRTATAYGEPAAVTGPDLLEYLAWRKRMRGLS